MSSSKQPSGKEVVDRDRIIADLRRLGVQEGDHLNVKVSLKAIGYVDGGPRTVIEALREVVGSSGTLFTDAFVNAYPLPLSEEHKAKVSRADTPSYAGALANAMLACPDAHRSPHPVQKFVGVGALAEELTQGHTVESEAYGLLKVLAGRGGKNLKIGEDAKVPGVGTTHVAIETLGIPRDRPRMGTMWETPEGQEELFEIFWAGGCERAWLKFYPVYEEIGAILGQGPIGKGPAKLTDMAKTLEWELEHIGNDRRVLLCGRGSCRICALQWEFSHKSRLRWEFHRTIDRVLRKLGKGKR